MSPNPFGVETDEFKGYRLNKQHLEDSTVDTIEKNSDYRSTHFLGTTITNKACHIMLAVVLLVAVIFIGRAGWLQIVQGDYYGALAESNSLRIETIPASRGVIYDRHGNLLVENVPAFTVTIRAADLPDDTKEYDQVLDSVAEYLDLTRGEIEATLLEYEDVPLEAVPIVKGVGHQTAMKIAANSPELPGVDLVLSTLRSYATDAARSLSHILGFMGKIGPEEIDELIIQGYRRTDEIGQQGIEESYEEILRGINGKKIIEVDALGLESAIVNEEPSVDGTNLTLSLDADLQSYIEMRLLEYQEDGGQAKVAVVALDPNNGELLSLVSLPTFDSNDFSGGIESSIYNSLLNDEDQPLFPRAISGEYPSGSTFKPVVAAAALSEGLINEYTTFLSTGGISISEWFFPDWRAGGHGSTDVRWALADSVNTFFYIIGGGLDDFVGLGVARITEYAEKFGLGDLTGIDIAGEASGFLPSKEWKERYKNERWYVGDTYHLAIGQGDISVTPLQIAVMTSIFANGGMLYTPHLLHGTDSEGSDVRKDVTSESIDTVRSGLRMAVTDGSARYLLSVTEPVAGKTGTAQAGGDKENHAWFTGFGPYDNPEIVLTVLVEEGGEGSSISVPIARDIFNWWFDNR